MLPLIRVYVDKTALDRNREDGGNRAPFLVVYDGAETPAYGVKINGECELIYNPLASPIQGIVAYLETAGDVSILSRSGAARNLPPVPSTNLTGENNE